MFIAYVMILHVHGEWPITVPGEEVGEKGTSASLSHPSVQNTDSQYYSNGQSAPSSSNYLSANNV